MAEPPDTLHKHELPAGAATTILNVDLPCAAVVGLVGLASVTWSVGAYNGQRGAT